MHRHGYQGRKFGRQRDQRRALLRGLANSLVLDETVETTLPKAKELVRYSEKLITRAKVGSLHSRRQVISRLTTLEAAHKLVDELAPKLINRNSGHLRVTRSAERRGDGVQLAKVSFVDDLSKPSKASKSKVASQKSQVKNKTVASKASKIPQKKVNKKAGD